MKTAIVHDWLTSIAGGEKVLQEIHSLYPSPIYTLVKNNQGLEKSYFQDKEIITSVIQNFPLSQKLYRSYLPFFPYAIEQFDLSNYDMIISSSSCVAKGVLTNQDQLHICYCNTPMRYAWDLYHQYLNESNLKKGIKAFFAKYILHYLRMWDLSSLNRVDEFIANSNFIAKRIKKIYGRESSVVYPPVDVEEIKPCTAKDNYYLTASRIVPYKKMDLIVEAFSKMKDKKLVVIGDGPDFKKIKEKATSNIEILGYVDDAGLRVFLQKAKAFVFAAVEDFGILPVEAQAAATPVIALYKGGVKETVIDGKTGLFFEKQNIQDIIEAVNKFEKMDFDLEFIRKHSEKFSKTRFREEFLSFTKQKIKEFNIKR